MNIPISLSGNFGELRPNHFHMGMDIKTMARENLPVFAAADGYISRIKIEPAGFGRAIYINHPNGFTTLYAHLNDFSAPLTQYVKDQQYRQESWRVYLELPPGLFPVRKGDYIANSGNTGGSQAPHLHFEVRRTADDVNLNPLLFGFPLADNTSPVIRRFAIYDRNKSTYEQAPKLIAVQKSGKNYISVPSVITVSSSRASFAISAFDTHTGSSNMNGIYEAWLYDNETLVTGFQMDNISYNDTRYLNAHIDYKTRVSGGIFLQHLSELPGYLNSIYIKTNGNGVIDLSDGSTHAIRIVVKDTNGNTSELSFSVRYSGVPVSTASAAGKMFYPMILDVYEDAECEFYMSERCLYDSVHIRKVTAASTSPAAVSSVHTIGSNLVPLQDSFLVRLKLNKNLTESQKDRVIMMRSAGSSQSVQKVEWNGNWASARFRDFGSFQLMLDESPPVILPVGLTSGASLAKASRILFTVKDNYDKFGNFRATLDGKWLRFTNDKGRTFIYNFDEKCPPGEHELKIHVEDEAGNVTERVFQFKR
jgi:murein DD-endopeptidase MepM/ murein hydrolase activator NlpD